MTDVDAQDTLELAAADDQQPVEAFTADGADPVGCRYSISCGRGEFVFVEQATEEVVAMYVGGVGRGIASGDRSVDRVGGS